jgi:hypothetical protein
MFIMVQFIIFKHPVPSLKTYLPRRSLVFSIDLIFPALGSTQAPTEMSTRNLPGGKVRPSRKADNLTAICELIA